MGGMEEKMLQNIILLFLEKICEAIYFSLFLIYGKNLKEKRLLFIGIMIFEYIMITKLIQFSIWIHISYIAMTYINLKTLYKDKAQITDIFLFMVASIILIVLSFISYIIIQNTIKIYIVALILSRILMFITLFLIKNEINKIYKNFYLLWNKHKNPNKVRSLTLRNISIIIFNIMFYVINIGMLIAFNFYN